MKRVVESRGKDRALGPNTVTAPIEPFSQATQNNLDKVLYRYPKGMATSYAADFRSKEPQKPIPIFNMNTYRRQPYPHKMDLKTTKQVRFLMKYESFNRWIFKELIRRKMRNRSRLL